MHDHERGEAGGAESAPLRVLAVMPGITPDAGAEQSLAAVAPLLATEGIELHLALLTDRQTLAPTIVEAGGVIHDLSATTSAFRRTVALRRLIRKIRPGVVHATLYEATLPAQLAVIGTGVPILVTWANTNYTPEHLGIATVASFKVRLVQASEVVLARAARASFHAVTAGVGRVNARNLRVPAARVYVGERGRDPERFVPDPERATRVAAEFEQRSIGRYVLAVGRQDRQKGYPDLVRQFDRLAATRTDVDLVIAGREGSASADLAEALRNIRFGDRVHLLGQRDDVEALMANADAIVCASAIEGAAGALIEAMASGLPIVCVPLDGLEDVLVDRVNALVAPRDRLATALAEVLDDPDLAKELAAAGRRTFDERFTIDRSGRRLAEIYRLAASPSRA